MIYCSYRLLLKAECVGGMCGLVWNVFDLNTVVIDCC